MYLGGCMRLIRTRSRRIRLHLQQQAFQNTHLSKHLSQVQDHRRALRALSLTCLTSRRRALRALSPTYLDLENLERPRAFRALSPLPE